MSSSFSFIPNKGSCWSWQKAAQLPAAWPGFAPSLLLHLDTLFRGSLLTRSLHGAIHGDLNREPGSQRYSQSLSLAVPIL